MDRINDSAEELKNLLRSISKNFRSYVQGQIGEMNFTAPQLMVLKELYDHPDVTLKDLSELVCLAKSTVCGIIDRLEMQGAVIRVRDTDDRRNVKISLSPKVSEITEMVNVIKANYVAGLLKQTGPGEVEKILVGLRVLNTLTEEHKRGR